MARASTAAVVEPEDDQPFVGGFEDISMDRDAVPDLIHLEPGNYTLSCIRASVVATGPGSKTPGAPMIVWLFRAEGYDAFPLRDNVVLPLPTDDQDTKDGKIRRIRSTCEALELRSINTIGELVAAVQEGMFDGRQAIYQAAVSLSESSEYGPQNGIRYWVTPK
jgi:hypothetical protein